MTWTPTTHRSTSSSPASSATRSRPATSNPPPPRPPPGSPASTAYPPVSLKQRLRCSPPIATSTGQAILALTASPVRPRLPNGDGFPALAGEVGWSSPQQGKCTPLSLVSPTSATPACAVTSPPSSIAACSWSSAPGSIGDSEKLTRLGPLMVQNRRSRQLVAQSAAGLALGLVPGMASMPDKRTNRVSYAEPLAQPLSDDPPRPGQHRSNDSAAQWFGLS
jgi:hypothetical protein